VPAVEDGVTRRLFGGDDCGDDETKEKGGRDAAPLG
jgi:hypothetical protein